MSKRNQRSSSSSSTQSRPSPKRFLSETPSRNMESGSQDETNGDRTSLDRIMDKLSYLENRIEEHFGGLKSDISSLRHELNEEIENVRSTMKDVEKSLEAAWNVITDLQEVSRTHSDSKKTCQSNLDQANRKLDMMTTKNTKLETEIEALKTKLSEEQEKIIALETYSRRENLRFMNIQERENENCMDTIYDIIENELNIDVENLQFHAVHRVGKVRSSEGETSKTYPRPIIARFLCREDRDMVFKAKRRLRNSTRYKDCYIAQDYEKAIQMDRKVLIKAMFVAGGKGMNAKVVDT